MKIISENLSKEDSKYIEKILTHINFPWFIGENRYYTTKKRDIDKLKKNRFKNLKYIKESPQFNHTFYTYDHNKKESYISVCSIGYNT